MAKPGRLLDRNAISESLPLEMQRIGQEHFRGEILEGPIDRRGEADMFAFQDRGWRIRFLGFELCNEFFCIALEPAAAAAWFADLLAIFLYTSNTRQYIPCLSN
jgi:hypothetical protein